MLNDCAVQRKTMRRENSLSSHVSACAAADGLLGDQLVPLGLGQPCHHQVAGMTDELEHVLVGY
jgi:hypothetical protein